jgi:hypothetical protein
MPDMDDARLKAEIDQIVAKIRKTIKKIEGVVPLKDADTAPSGDAEGVAAASGDAPAPQRSQIP